MVYCGTGELNDSFFRIPVPGTRKPDWLPGDERGATEDFTGGDYLDGFCSLCPVLPEGTSAFELPVGIPVYSGCRVLYFPGENDRHLEGMPA